MSSTAIFRGIANTFAAKPRKPAMAGKKSEAQAQIKPITQATEKRGVATMFEKIAIVDTCEKSPAENGSVIKFEDRVKAQG